jgi:hypothetical protein
MNVVPGQKSLVIAAVEISDEEVREARIRARGSVVSPVAKPISEGTEPPGLCRGDAKCSGKKQRQWRRVEVGLRADDFYQTCPASRESRKDRF